MEENPIVFEDIPYFNKTEYQRNYQRDYNKTANAKAAKKKYRHDNSKHVTDAVYLSRPIVAIDGEGINVRRGPRKGDHLYIMLAISGVPPIIDTKGLKTRAILDYLWENLDPKNINVIYGGSYDFNMWLSDLMADELKMVYKSTYGSIPLWYAGYGIRWIRGKSFEITDGERTIVINDVISFFQSSFVNACDSYLGEEWEGRDVIMREKKRRGNFTADEVANVAAYNSLELDRLVDLVGELRSRLNRVGLRPRRWNSPGAIAAALFLREHIKEHRNENLPPDVQKAARYAYAGGRFEMIKYGAVKESVYEYDINSAYPRALLEVPSLANGKWIHHKRGFLPASGFSLYRVRFEGSNLNIPGPIFVRGANGTISYPINATNWIWSPEYEVVKEYCDQVSGTKYTVLEAWEFIPDTDYKPFHFIAPLYAKRQILKAAGDGAHMGIKLGLNSMYGKLCQQVGWKAATEKYPARVPTYHQLEWAGYVTSWCRANILRAALLDLDSVIAFETDALFTSRPLPVKTGTALGEWEETRFRSLTYVQSGHYYGTDSKGKGIIKCRGIDKGFIKRKRVEKALALPEHSRVLEAKLTRFYGAGIALARGVDKYWRKWITEPKILQLMPTGKRLHGNCWCDGRGPLELGKWHLTFCPVAGGESAEYPVQWINPDPNMTELAELRESEIEYDD